MTYSSRSTSSSTFNLTPNWWFKSRNSPPKRITHCRIRRPVEHSCSTPQPTQNMINFRKQHTIQIHNPTDRKDHTQITTLKHKQIDFLTVTRNFQIRKTEQDVTEPKYFAAVVRQKIHLTTLTQPRSYNSKPRL